IDCPPSIGILTQNAIVASSHLLIPAEPKMYTFAGMHALNQMIVGLGQEYEFDIELLGVLLTMVERGPRLHRAVMEVIRERFGDKVFETIIYRSVRISEAELEGKPVLSYDSHSPGAHSYAALADEILRRLQSAPVQSSEGQFATHRPLR